MLAYGPFWNGLDTLRVPLAFLAGRRPTNSLAELAFVAIRPILGSAAATAALSALGTLLTAGFALLGAVLAWRAPDPSALAGAMAVVISSTTSFSAAVVSNFTWNRYWTYPESRSKPLRRQLAQFFVVNTIGYFIRTPILLVLVKPYTALVARLLGSG